MRTTTWAQFKNIANKRKLDIVMLEYEYGYELFCSDGAFAMTTTIDIPSDDCTDFEANYKSLCNLEKRNIVQTATPINEHCMQPWGCEKGYFKSKNATEGDYVCAITLSNKSQDGLTFTYNSDMPITLAVGNYVFQTRGSKRSWVTSFDVVNHTVTFELPFLEEGTAVYSKGYYTDSLVRDWAPTMYLWGLTLTVQEYENGVLETNPCGDLIELAIIDKDNLFLTDGYCQAVFGVDAASVEPYLLASGFEMNGEYGCWTKYYDESWILSCNGMYTPAPDGSPGEIPAGQYLRLSFFTTENEEHEYCIYVDYYPTSKS